MTNSESPAHGSGPGAAATPAFTPTNSPRTDKTNTAAGAAAKVGTAPKYVDAIEADAPRHVPVQRSMYSILVGIFTGILLISNITATKGVELFGLVTDGAFFLFPLSYIIGDVLSEVYGFRATRRAVYTGFAVLAIGMASFFIAINLPPAGFYENQEAFETVLGTVPQLVLAGLAGYLVGQLLNAWSLTAIKRRTGEKSLWMRLIGSTVVGEFADTLIFCSIAASAIGISTWGDFINFVIVGFLWKTGVEVVVLPVTYQAIAWVKKREGYYDVPAAA